MTDQAALRRQGAGFILACRVQPRARTNAFGEVRAGEVLVKLTAPPVDGKANDALRRFVADAFGVPLSAVAIESGERGRHKRLRISGEARVPDALIALASNG